MITKIKIKNFKSIIDLELDLEGLKTILVGQNEAGKSSILEALDAHELRIIDIETLNYECENEANRIQKISIEYNIPSSNRATFLEKIINGIEELLDDADIEHKLQNEEFRHGNLANLKSYTLTTIFEYIDGQGKVTFEIDHITVEKILNAFQPFIISKSLVVDEFDLNLDAFFALAEINTEIAELFEELSPEIFYFDDFADLLPDKIGIDKIYDDSKVEGKAAVKNLEKLLNISFRDLQSQNVGRKKSNTEKACNEVTINFLNDWNQKINNTNQLRIEFDIQKNERAIDEVHFFIETKEGVKLEPRKRSQGLRWFLSLWLELKAESKDRPVVLLFDEPGAFLHINAMKDMMNVFDNLIRGGNQIIYSTHLPSMIDLKRLEDIKLVIHDKKKGTVIEKLTSSRFDSITKRDALQPIAQAMGMQPLTEFSVLRQKNVLVEGLSDMFYFQSMQKLLNLKDDFAIIPGIGVKSEKLNSLISFCIGYGLDWLVVVDNGYNPEVFKNQLLKSLNDEGESTLNFDKVFTCEHKEIEDIFSVDDMKLLGLHMTNNSDKSVSELIGKRKILFAQRFKQLVEEKIITKESLSHVTIENFKGIFDWIELKFKVE